MLPYIVIAAVTVVLIYGMYKMANLRKVSLSVWKFFNITVEGDNGPTPRRRRLKKSTKKHE